MAAKSKPAPWNSFTKAELIRTIKTLSARETKHLNRIVALEKVARDAQALVDALGAGIVQSMPDRIASAYGGVTQDDVRYPWQELEAKLVGDQEQKSKQARLKRLRERLPERAREQELRDLINVVKGVLDLLEDEL